VTPNNMIEGALHQGAAGAEQCDILYRVSEGVGDRGLVEAATALVIAAATVAGRSHAAAGVRP